tara:strand:- start:1255 stop:1518 length:264 start_codon:yes stop_codon:yes gene_type:complete
MYRTLSELKDQVNSLIEQQGENATCASFIYTKEDVFYFNDVENDEVYLPVDDANQVLNEVGDTDYIYQQIGELIDDEVSRIRRQKEV